MIYSERDYNINWLIYMLNENPGKSWVEMRNGMICVVIEDQYDH
jgi:hypothetical protein